MKTSTTAKWIASSSLALAAGLAFAGGDPYLRPQHAPAPADNLPSAARVKLGNALFFDPRLSGSNWISCATCHNPSLGWSDGLATGIGHDMKRLNRATPTILNAAFNPIQMWDGRKATLEDQALGPIQADVEMNQDLPELIKKLSAIPGYHPLFEAAYPGEGISGATISKAIASYERTVLSTESPFDRWRKGDEKAVSAPAKRGFKLFTGKAGCSNCHESYNFTDNGFHNIGLKSIRGDDVGRFAQKPVAAMRGAFKTPTLRDIALTAPYMHNGIYATLEEVVDHYDRGGDVKDNLSGEIKPLALSPQEKAELVEFLKTLTGKPALVAVPRLPQ
jgi:cytochrome c peroxidase